MITPPFLNRRRFLKSSSAAALAGVAGLSMPLRANAAETVNFATWSAAVDLVQSHISAFEAANPDVSVSYSNAPWAQYRESTITKFVGGAPVDMLWVSDSWLPEWAEAGWLAPIDQYDELTKYNEDTDDFSLQSMIYGGQQYGLTYYNDYIAFLYNAEILKNAGIAAPPTTWEEVVEQSRIIKEKGLSDAPLMIALAQESWLVEFLSTLVFSHGGRFTDDDGNAIMADPQGGAVAALTWLRGAIDAGVLPASCVETGELAALKSFGAGQNAFTMVAKYRLRMLNDPAQSPAAGNIKQALMPKGGPNGTNETVGYIRFYGMTPRAQETDERAAATVKLIEWFGGKANGEYVLQKLLFKDLGLGFAVKSLFQDQEIRDGYAVFGDVDLISQQQNLARKKDVIAPWFGEWNDINGTAWQQAVLGRATPEEALRSSAETWDRLKQEA
mgnify:CR=1 FL=1